MQAFAGLVAVLQSNPAILSSSRSTVPALLLACASWEESPEDPLLTSMRDLLLAIKGGHPQWAEVVRKMDRDLRDRFLTTFRLM